MPGEVLVRIIAETVTQVVVEAGGEMVNTAVRQAPSVSPWFRLLRVVLLLALAAVTALILLVIIAQPFSLGILVFAVIAGAFLIILGIGIFRDLDVLLSA